MITTNRLFIFLLFIQYGSVISAFSNSDYYLTRLDSVCTTFNPSDTFLPRKFSKMLESQRVGLKESSQVAVYKSVAITAGGLYSALTATELSNLTDLYLYGTMDARDFKTMRDEMPALINIDLSNVSIVSYTGNAGTDDTDGVTYPALAIPSYAFIGKSILSISLPNNLKIIDDGAFYKTAITSITVPNSVTTINELAFLYSDLTSINISESVTSIGYLAFTCSVAVASNNPYYCSTDGVLFDKNKKTLLQCPNTMTSQYTIPSTVTKIDTYAFFECVSITGLIIPSSVDSIGYGAFRGMYNLGDFTIPASVNYIGTDALLFCGGNITVEATNPNFSGKDGVLFNKDQTILYHCPFLRSGSYSIPSTVKVIGRYAFNSLHNITSITIPNTVIEFGFGAFINCSKLTTITIPGSVTTYNFSVFSDCANLKTIYSRRSVPADLTLTQRVFSKVDTINCILYVPTGSRSLYSKSDQWKAFQSIVETNIADSYLTTSKNQLLFTDQAETTSINVSASSSWTVKSNAAWLTISPVSGSSLTNILTISVLNNPNPYERNATVTFSSSGLQDVIVQITQKGYPIVFSVNPSSIISVSNLNSERMLVISSNTDWTVHTNVDWITTKTTTGSKNDTISIEVLTNNTSSQRTGFVVFSGSYISTNQVSIQQQAGAVAQQQLFNQKIKQSSENLTAKATIYPNPVNDNFTIHDIEPNSRLTVFDLAGNKLMQFVVSNDDNIAVSSLKGGFYHIEIIGPTRRSSIKIMKQ